MLDEKNEGCGHEGLWSFPRLHFSLLDCTLEIKTRFVLMKNVHESFDADYKTRDIYFPIHIERY